jgi:hypothetical protein
MEINDEQLVKILKKYSSIFKITTENCIAKAMYEYAILYHKQALAKKKREDIREILYYYHNKYKFDTSGSRFDTESQVIMNYFLNEDKTQRLLNKIKDEKKNKNNKS